MARLVIIRPPVLHATASEVHRHSTWSELFFDLAYAVAIGIVGEGLGHDPSLSGLLAFLLVFVPIMWSWAGFTAYNDRFDTPDLLHRGLTFVQVLGVANLALNLHGGIEGFVVRYDGATRHVVMTYRGAPLEGGDTVLISTMEHTELGARWVYDGTTDPTALAAFRRALLGEQDRAIHELWEDDKLVGVREPTVQLTPLVADGVSRDAALTIYDDLDAEPQTGQAGCRLEAAWDGGHGVLATLG